MWIHISCLVAHLALLPFIFLCVRGWKLLVDEWVSATVAIAGIAYLLLYVFMACYL